MLANILKTERSKRDEFREGLISKHIAHAEKMRKVKEIIDGLSDGLLYIRLIRQEVPNDINISSYNPAISIENVGGGTHINNAEFNDNGEIEHIFVSGLGTFALMGEKHTMESFFKKIARYL